MTKAKPIETEDPQRPFFKCYPSNLLSGCIKLSAEEKGVYYTLLMLLYDGWEAIDDGTVKQRQDLARFCGTSTRGFTTIRDRLLTLPEKLTRDADGRLTNARFERERAWLAKFKTEIEAEKKPSIQKINGPLNRPTSNENKDLLDPSCARESRLQSLDSIVPDEKGALSEESEQIVESEIQQICRAIGVELRQSTKRNNWPYHWVQLRTENNLIVEDMVAAIDSYSGQFKGEQCRSLGMYKARAIEKRVARELNDRLAGRAQRARVIDASNVSAEEWGDRLRLFVMQGTWSPAYGPSPLEPGPHLVPEPMLVNAQRYWVEQGNHPRIMHYGGTAVPWVAGKAGMVRKVTPFAPR